MIADASPLILLAKAGHLDLLRGLHVRTPATVWAECTADPPLPDAQTLRNALSDGLVEVVPDPPPGLGTRFPHLDAGELAAIALALRARDSLLVDDHAAKRVAKQLGVVNTGVLGLVLDAWRKKRLTQPQARAALTDLLAAGLWVSPQIVDAIRDELDGQP